MSTGPKEPNQALRIYAGVITYAGIPMYIALMKYGYYKYKSSNPNPLFFLALIAFICGLLNMGAGLDIYNGTDELENEKELTTFYLVSMIISFIIAIVVFIIYQVIISGSY